MLGDSPSVVLLALPLPATLFHSSSSLSSMCCRYCCQEHNHWLLRRSYVKIGCLLSQQPFSWPCDSRWTLGHTTCNWEQSQMRHQWQMSSFVFILAYMGLFLLRDLPPVYLGLKKCPLRTMMRYSGWGMAPWSALQTGILAKSWSTGGGHRGHSQDYL